MATAIAQAQLPAVDLVLLVGRADGLPFLQPEVLPVEALRDWASNPARYRVVLTYSYTSDSIAERLLANSDFGVADVRRHLLEQIRRCDIDVDESWAERIFALEHGTSWASVSSRVDGLARIATPIREQMLAELAHDITRSCSTFGRLRAAFEVHGDVERRRLAQEEKKAAEQQRLDTEWKRHLDAARTIEKHCKWAADERERFDKSIKQITATIKNARGLAMNAMATYNTEIESEDVSGLQSWLGGAKTHFRRCWEGLSDKAAKEVERDVRSAAALVLRRCGPLPSMKSLDPIISRLRQYRLNAYWSKRHWNRDLEDARAAVQAWESELRDSAARVICDVLAEESRSLKREIERVNCEYRDYQAALRRHYNAADALAQKRLELDQAHAIRMAEMAGDLERSRDFDRRLSEAYHAERRHAAALILDAARTGRGGAALLQLIRLRDARENYARLQDRTR